MDQFVANESCQSYTNGVTSLQKRNLRSNDGNEENHSNSSVTCSVMDKNHTGNEGSSEKTGTDVDYDSIRLLTLKEAPGHLTFNRNIHRGYRRCLTTSQCVDRLVLSLSRKNTNFWVSVWTNYKIVSIGVCRWCKTHRSSYLGGRCDRAEKKSCEINLDFRKWEDGKGQFERGEFQFFRNLRLEIHSAADCVRPISFSKKIRSIKADKVKTQWEMN